MHRHSISILSATLVFGLLPALSAGDRAAPKGQVLAYKLEPRQPLKYRLVADIKGRFPVGESTEPLDLTASLSFTYTAAPKTRLADGTSDVDFKVEAVELELLKIPFPIPDEEARRVLDLTVTFARTGEALKVQTPGDELPFSVSVPGVDPKRLYALIFPVVFQKSPVAEGTSWNYRSDLLGGQGTTPKFTATLLAPAKGADPKTTARVKAKFEMPVDQKVDADKKPTYKSDDVHRARSGKIVGEGIYLFDRQKGRLTRGEVKMRANITDRLVGKPLTENEPAELVSAIEANLTIELVTGESKPAVKAASARTGLSLKQARKQEKP